MRPGQVLARYVAVASAVEAVRGLLRTKANFIALPLWAGRAYDGAVFITDTLYCQISGYIIRKMKKRLKCVMCYESLLHIGGITRLRVELIMEADIYG